VKHIETRWLRGNTIYTGKHQWLLFWCRETCHVKLFVYTVWRGGMRIHDTKQHKLPCAFIQYHLCSIHFNPLSASCSCDARIGGCRQNRLLIPRSPFSRHPPIRRHSLPQRTSQCCISPRKIKFPMNPFCVKSLKLTIMWWPYGTERVQGQLWLSKTSMASQSRALILLNQRL
jgi:hypothetical protein